MTKKNNKGAAMIMAVCLMAIVLALSLSLLLSASVVLSSSQNEIHREQARIMAVSISRQIEQQLTNSKYEFTTSKTENNAYDGSIWYFVKNGISSGSWPYFNEDERGHTARYSYKTMNFDLTNMTTETKEKLKNLAQAKVVLYWESSDGTSLDGSPMTVKVTCSDGKQKCTIATEYTLGIDSIWGYEKWSWSLNWRE